MNNSIFALALNLILTVSLITPVYGSDSRATKEEVVRIDGGMVRGTKAKDLIVFKGIPYAAPPVGDLRWRNLQPVMA